MLNAVLHGPVPDGSGARDKKHIAEVLEEKGVDMGPMVENFLTNNVDAMVEDFLTNKLRDDKVKQTVLDLAKSELKNIYGQNDNSIIQAATSNDPLTTLSSTDMMIQHTLGIRRAVSLALFTSFNGL